MSDAIRLFVSVMIESLQILWDRKYWEPFLVMWTLRHGVCSEGRETLFPADMKEICIFIYSRIFNQGEGIGTIFRLIL